MLGSRWQTTCVNVTTDYTKTSIVSYCHAQQGVTDVRCIEHVKRIRSITVNLHPWESDIFRLALALPEPVGSGNSPQLATYIQVSDLKAQKRSLQLFIKDVVLISISGIEKHVPFGFLKHSILQSLC